MPCPSKRLRSAAWVEHSRLQASLKVCRQSEVAEDLLLSLEKSDPEKKMRSLLVSSGFANFDCHEIERCRQLLERVFLAADFFPALSPCPPMSDDGR